MKNKNTFQKSNIKYQKGQALIMLLFFMMIGIMITTAAVSIIASNSLGANDVAQGEIAKEMAETGGEKAVLSILRNGTGYTGETLTSANMPDWDSGWNVVINVSYDSGSSTYTINSKATAGNYVRQIRVTAAYSASNELTVSSWKEF